MKCERFEEEEEEENSEYKDNPEELDDYVDSDLLVPNVANVEAHYLADPSFNETDAPGDSEIAFASIIKSENQTYYSCKACGHKYKKIISLMKHFREKHEVPKTVGPFLCPKCGAKYTRRDTFKRHINYECGVPRKYKCKVCDSRFKRMNHLKRHMEIHIKHFEELKK